MDRNTVKNNNKNIVPNFQGRKSSTAAKKAKSKKKPMKVVYISNPMKFKASASEFRALVQELTGQDAEFPDPTKFTSTDGDDHVGGILTAPDAPTKAVDDDDDDDALDPSPEQHEREEHGPSISTDQSFDQDDAFIMPQADSFPSFWFDSSSHHHLHHHHHNHLDVLTNPYNYAM